jgi:SAM-dependent methyltransferase
MMNQTQSACWTESHSQLWLAHQDRVTSIASPHGRVAMDAAAVSAGERALDVGCGTGPTTIDLARRAGDGGSVLGVDVSPLLIEAARSRIDDAGLENVDLIVADAQSADLGSGFDIVYSRFGVMFFDDAVAAFANMRKATRDGGRLVFSCWQSPMANPWMGVPTMAAASVFTFVPQAPGAPGQFSLMDPGYVRKTLSAAGFSGIDVQPCADTVEVFVEDADLDQVMRMGPMRDEYADADAQTRERAFVAIRDAVAPFGKDGRFEFPSASWTVRASA